MSTAKTSTGKSTKVLPGRPIYIIGGATSQLDQQALVLPTSSPGIRASDWLYRRRVQGATDGQGRGRGSRSHVALSTCLAEPACPLTAVAGRSVPCDSFNDDPEGPPPPIPQSKSGPSRPAPDGVRKPDCRGQDSPVSIREGR